MSQRAATYKQIFQCLIIFIAFNIFSRLKENSLLTNVFTEIAFLLLSIYLSWQLSKLITRSGIKVSPSDKAVLVTGCDSGFGHHLVQQLAASDFQVFAGVLKLDGLGADKLKKIERNLHVIELDVRKDSHIEKAKEFVTRNLQPGRKLWAVVNNAGVGYYGGIEWGPASIEIPYKETFEVNTFGVVRVTKAFLPMLRQVKNSRVVIVSSLCSRFAFPGLASYSMSKHAVRALGDSLRREVKPYQVNVSIIEPCMYVTPITDMEICLANMKSNWANTSEERKNEIGEIEYVELEKKVCSFLQMRRSNLQEVILPILDSITALDPRTYYKPGGYSESLMLYFLQFLPEQIQDFFLDGTTFNSILNLIHNQS